MSGRTLRDAVAKGVLRGEPRWQGSGEGHDWYCWGSWGSLGSPGEQSKPKALAREWREDLAPGEWRLVSSLQLLLSHK